MRPEDKRFCEVILRHLFVGQHINGVRFGPILGVVISTRNHQFEAGSIMEPTLFLSSNWGIFDSIPKHLLNSSDQRNLPELTINQELGLLFELNEITITDIRLAKTKPHLIITFENNKILFLHGFHHKYESWHIGARVVGQPNGFLFGASPGGGVWVFMPDEFLEAWKDEIEGE